MVTNWVLTTLNSDSLVSAEFVVVRRIIVLLVHHDTFSLQLLCAVINMLLLIRQVSILATAR